ncbi:MAG: transposase family protein [Candidatus Thiodiazotropha sp.]
MIYVCRGRGSIEPGEKLVITLRFLATGMSFKSLQYGFRVGHNTISLFVPEVCRAIFEEYRGELFVLPSTHDEWREVSQKFGNRWNFHHACGAIDGKHVAIKKPHNSGSEFFNYKRYCSIVMLGVVDAEYKFIWAGVGSEGSASDAGIFSECSLRTALEDNSIGFPPAEPLPQDDRNVPYFLLGDDAFPLRTWLMKPYSMRGMTHEQRVFNYRQSRARRVVENAFGILAHRWRCLLTTMQCSVASTISIVWGALTLHNWMRTRAPGLQLPEVDQEDGQGNVILGAWRQGRQLLDGQQRRGPLITRDAKTQRDYLCAYYNSPVGRLPWQDQIV